MMLNYLAGMMSSRIAKLTNEFVTDLYREDKETLQEYIDMLEKDPVARACCDLKALRLQSAIGDYEHENKQYQEWIRKNFENIEGSFRGVVGQLGSAMPLGFAVAEIICAPIRGEWRLKELNVLDPRRVTFAGKVGQITHVVYLNNKGEKIHIPYYKCIHIVNGLVTNFDSRRAYGSAESKRAMNYYKLKQIVLTEMSVAAKNNATGIIVGKVKGSESVQLVDARGNAMTGLDGKPTYIPATQALSYQLQNIENSSIVVTDKENDIFPLKIDSGESFWTNALQYIDGKTMLSYGVPQLVFNEGSSAFGNSSLSQGHRSILDSNIESLILQIRDQLIEKVVRPLLWHNYGEKNSFGSFAYQQSSDPAVANARVSTLISAIASQIFSSTDPDIVNKLREDLDLPPLSEDEVISMRQQKDQQKLLAELQNELQMQQTIMQQQQPEAGATDPNQQYP